MVVGGRDIERAFWRAPYRTSGMVGVEALGRALSAVVEAPSVLGLFPRGVERLPEALLDAGLADAVGSRRAGRVVPPLLLIERP
jgi:hypothetical protein